MVSPRKSSPVKARRLQPSFLSFRDRFRSNGRMVHLTLIGICTSIILFLFPFDAVVKPSQSVYVFAIYYPIYHSKDWKRIQLTEKPVLGEYGTDNPIVAATHISWATSNAIDGFLISWEGRSSITDTHLREGLLAARNIDRMKFFLVYEGTAILPDKGSLALGPDFNNFSTRHTFVKDIEQMSQYFWHKSYFSISSRPVIVLRSSKNYLNLPHGFLTSVKAQLGIDMYFVGDENCNHRGQNSKNANRRTSVCVECDAFTTLDATTENSENSVFTDTYRGKVPAMRACAHQSPFFPMVTPKLNLYGPKSFAGNATEFWKQMKHLRSYRLSPVSRTLRSIFVVRSFNHWYEGSAVEPAREFGFDYLNAIDVAFRD